jgi:hypothetical protein
MASFRNNDPQGRRLARYAWMLVLIAVLLVLAGAAMTALLWSSSWQVVLLLAADAMLIAVAVQFARVAVRVRRACRLEILQIDLDGDRMTLHYGGRQEQLSLGACRVERGGEQDDWDFRIRTAERGYRLRTAGFSDAEQLHALLARRAQSPPEPAPEEAP